MRMESDDFDFLASTYVRGFLRSYARYLMIDPAPLVTEFDSRYGSRKVDEAKIMASERRSRRSSIPRQRSRMSSSWTVAAGIAAAFLLALFVIGVTQPNNSGGNKTGNEQATSNQAADASPSPSSSKQPPSPSGGGSKPSPDSNTIAFDNGIDVKILATRGPCWVGVTADGSYTQQIIAVGQKASYAAQSSMIIKFGAAASVDLIVNGHNIGAPSDATVYTITLPDDLQNPH